LGVLGRGAGDERVEGGGQGAVERAHRRDRRLDDLPHQLVLGVGVERDPPRQRLEEGDPDRVEVGAGVDVLRRAQVLGGHVGEGAHLRARRGAELLRSEDLGDPEVGDLGEDLAPVQRLDEHVGRLQVAVDETAGVGEPDPGKDLREDGHREVRGEGPPGRDQPIERDALHELHDDREVLLVGDEVEDGHDAGVVELGLDDRLGLEPLDHLRVSVELRVEDLDRHRPVETRIRARVHRSHPSLADQIPDEVGPDAVARLGGSHRCP
jgi:hypothetical protein